MSENFRNRTISSILDLTKGKEITSDDFFKKEIDEIFQLRYDFETAIREKNPRFVCYYCKQAVKIRGQRDSKVIMHFAHLRDSNECPIKTGNTYTKEEIQRIKYNGAKESELHYTLKIGLADFLKKNQEHRKGIEEVNIEKVIKDQAIPKIWKKPDVSSVYNGKSVVFELQLSTTFLSVINSRQEFYRGNKTYILWVFSSFDTDDDKRKFTQSDIFYNNNFNGFEFNQEAIELSEKENDLVLKCYYKRLYIKDLSIINEWDECMVKLQDLTFDNENYSVYYYNYSAEQERLEEELKTIKILEYSPLINLVKKENSNYEIINLILGGYKVKKPEKKYILSLYNDEIANVKVIDQDSWQVNIIWVTILLKIQNVEIIKRLADSHHLSRIIFDILSLKLNKILGYAFDNHRQIANIVLQSRTEYLDVFLKAVNEYRPGLFKIEDKKGKLVRTLKKLMTDKPDQKIENYDILKIMFPELF
ncbi:DUF6035 family protein [Paludibacter jiangxiensis]|uniref:Competence protein CoiA-like family protein n=1 Tax=Paludibacter jiangxiensis TaxID=681398 RepID=A0A170ZGZ0_9BACT|nr:DUF6035 family protein [Paludibacter jiangxiensis]GAT62658.1 hypothetical protein PJIAN_2218 [Paludibacter jiangxiensis]